MSWSTRPSLPAGHIVTADELDAILDQIDSLTGSGWTDYSGTFALTASSVNPTKGNSVYAAYWRRAAGSDLVEVRIAVTIGASGFVAGTGDYRFSLPVNASTAEIATGIGEVYYLDTSAGTNYVGVAVPVNTAYVQLIVDRQANYLGAANPVVPAAGDVYKIRFTYEPA